MSDNSVPALLSTDVFSFLVYCHSQAVVALFLGCKSSLFVPLVKKQLREGDIPVHALAATGQSADAYLLDPISVRQACVSYPGTWLSAVSYPVSGLAHRAGDQCR